MLSCAHTRYLMNFWEQMQLRIISKILWTREVVNPTIGAKARPWPLLPKRRPSHDHWRCF